MASLFLKRPLVSFIILFLIFFSPVFLMLNPGLVWDDHYYISQYIAHPLSSSLKPFAFDGHLYWRPISTLTMFIPLYWVQSLTLPGFMLLSKSFSFLIFITISFYSGRFIVSSKSQPQLHRSQFFILLFSALFLASHPVFAEPLMWFSDRYDLLLCLWIVLLLHYSFSTHPVSFQQGFIIALLTCLTKESGFFWVSGVLFFLWLSQPKSTYLKGLFYGTLLAILLRGFFIQFVSPDLLEGAVEHHNDPWSPVLFINHLGVSLRFFLTPFLDPGPLHYPTLTLPVFLFGCFFLLSFIGLSLFILKQALSSDQFVDSSLYFPLTWIYLAAVLLMIQYALVSSVDSSTFDFALTWVRYSTPSFLVLFLIVARHLYQQAPSLNPRNLVLFMFFIAITLSGNVTASFSKIAFSSEFFLWKSAHTSSPSWITLKHYCQELNKLSSSQEAALLYKTWEKPLSQTPVRLKDPVKDQTLQEQAKAACVKPS